MKSHANQHTGSSGTTAIVWRRATHRSSADRGSEGHPLSSRDAHHARPATSLEMRGSRASPGCRGGHDQPGRVQRRANRVRGGRRQRRRDARRQGKEVSAGAGGHQGSRIVHGGSAAVVRVSWCWCGPRTGVSGADSAVPVAGDEPGPFLARGVPAGGRARVVLQGCWVFVSVPLPGFEPVRNVTNPAARCETEALGSEVCERDGLFRGVLEPFWVWSRMAM